MKPQAISVYGVHYDGQGRALLIRDAHSGLWGFPGGGVEAGEPHGQALRRELMEETGLQAGDELLYITNQNDARKQRFFYTISMAAGGLKTDGNAPDVTQAGYFDVRQLPAPLAPGVEEVIFYAK